MSKLILCKFHDDHTPSMRIYGNWAHCYTCGAHVPSSEVVNGDYILPTQSVVKTDVGAAIARIKTLPTKLIRGLELPYDNTGYYILWPLDQYYKRRTTSGLSRYIAPAGINPPLFQYESKSKHLLIVEGELNAISLYNVVFGDYKVCSPGPATNFMKYIKHYLNYEKITIFADKDAPGVVFGDQLKQHLLKLHKRVTLVLLDKDFNQVLQDEGEQGVISLFEKVRMK